MMRHNGSRVARYFSSKATTQTPQLPSEVNTVIIGGGVIGCSIAYHLAKLGMKDVLLIEKAKVSHGASWHAAGVINQLRPTTLYTRFFTESLDLYEKWEKKGDLSTGCRRTGSIRVACNADRWEEIKADVVRSTIDCGIPAELITASDAKALCPVLRIDDVVGAIHIPSDGLCSPADVNLALATYAKRNGATIVEGVSVDSFDFKTSSSSSKRKVTRVNTSAGSIKVNNVVNAAGLWAREVAALANVSARCINLEHQYLVTEAIPEMLSNTDANDPLWKSLPTLRDPCASLYYKPESGGKILVGGWEPETVLANGTGSLPADFGPTLFDSNHDRFEQHAVNAIHRTPAMADAGISQLINGPIPFSADGNPLI